MLTYSVCVFVTALINDIAKYCTRTIIFLKVLMYIDLTISANYYLPLVSLKQVDIYFLQEDDKSTWINFPEDII